MNARRNSLLQFLGGLAMLIAGLFILSQRAYVTTGWFGMWGMPTTVIWAPLICGIVWMFATGSKLSKIFTGIAAFLIVLFVIFNTRVNLTYMTLFDWIVLLVLIFGGIGLIAKVLFADRPKLE